MTDIEVIEGGSINIERDEESEGLFLLIEAAMKQTEEEIANGTYVPSVLECIKNAGGVYAEEKEKKKQEEVDKWNQWLK